MSEDWNPNNPKWWTEQDPWVATVAAQGYYLTKLLKWGAIISLVLAVLGVGLWALYSLNLAVVSSSI